VSRFDANGSRGVALEAEQSGGSVTNDLLETAIEAHGDLQRWNQLETPTLLGWNIATPRDGLGTLRPQASAGGRGRELRRLC
jgi:hypothetical protein